MIIELLKSHNIISIYKGHVFTSTRTVRHGMGMNDIFNIYSWVHTKDTLHWPNFNTWTLQSIYTEMYMLQDIVQGHQNKYYILYSQTHYFINLFKSLYRHWCDDINICNLYVVELELPTLNSTCVQWTTLRSFSIYIHCTPTMEGQKNSTKHDTQPLGI